MLVTGCSATIFALVIAGSWRRYCLFIYLEYLNIEFPSCQRPGASVRGDLGWWWQNESPQSPPAVQQRPPVPVPPSCVLPPSLPVPSSFDIDVSAFCIHYVQRRCLLLPSPFCKHQQKSSKPSVKQWRCFRIIVPISGTIKLSGWERECRSEAQHI